MFCKAHIQCNQQFTEGVNRNEGSIPFTRSISCCATALVHELHAPIEALRDAIVFGNLTVNQNFSGQALLEYAALHLNPTQLTRT